MSNYKFRKLTNKEIWAVDAEKFKVHTMPCTKEEFPAFFGGLVSLFGKPYHVSKDGNLIQYWVAAEYGKNKVNITISYDKSGDYPEMTDVICFAVHADGDYFYMVEALVALIDDARPY